MTRSRVTALWRLVQVLSLVACAATLDACSSSAASSSGVDGGVTLVAKSPGKVTLRAVIPTDKTFCDQETGCAANGHIAILNEAGVAVPTGVAWCSTMCSSACTPSPCPGIACVSQGIAVKTSEFVWDGSAYTWSTCGNRVACFTPGYVPAGHYVARMCATPGTLRAADGGFPMTCTATAPVECVDVPFDLPSASPVEGHLP
jgi:hypothetical protein